MTYYHITTTSQRVLKAEDEDRKVIISTGAYVTGKIVFIGVGDGIRPEIILDANGTTLVKCTIPAKINVYVWTDAGTAEFCITLIE